MNHENYVRQSLHLQGLPAYEADIPYICSILSTINQAQATLKAFPNLNKEAPITVVDKDELMG